ncbi:Sushi, von Willebrand factor type A, EGF and pentraxin domain-containing protein 1 [Araneus ventricosus]|uniref:Sushi, von Willebrand factor type A, EGF and pentraxin domain-containing protein 1 n=1 Tax=Araneus ventricosus TaxID=182803 RepID=A0A4Y2ED21_ARAVE|nr:Sushi, von Willebrand factor type A, EGF and pentraxin domain-containing protein 1 [Araneus ventricosus]
MVKHRRNGLPHGMEFFLTCLVSGFVLFATVNACGYPGSPAHASVSFSTEVIGPATVATYTCDSGFEILGPARRVCTANGTWTPQGIPFCVLNVAVGKAPMQSSLAGSGIPQKAIDGSTSTFFNPDTCSMTQTERSPWWYVNLLEPYMVQLVRLDFGMACCSNNRPATIVVRVGNNRPDLGVNPICNKYTGFIEEGRPLFLPCTTAMPGAFVSVYLEEPAQNQLSICEAFVYTDQALPIERCPSFRDQPLGSTATYNGKCYIFFNNQPRNLLSARRFCEIRGGNLIDETSPALQGFLSWELFRRHRNDPNGQYWLGAVRDPRDPNNWKWINGQDVSVSFWSVPGTKENCSRFDGSKGWLWSETNCNLNLNYICQHKPSTCGKPERPANSTIVARNFDIGSVIEYKCNPGHLLVGPNIRTCLPSGFFSEFPPKCRYLECGDPAQIAQGSYTLINGTRHYLSTVQYSCDEGHVLVGRGSLVCDVDEKWNGPPPRCDPFYCRHPPPIENGHFAMSSNTTVFGTVTRYYCDEGFEMKGKDTIKCVASGYWNGEPPICTVKDDNEFTTHSVDTSERPKPTTPEDIQPPAITSSYNVRLEPSTVTYRPTPSSNFNSVVTYIPDTSYPSPADRQQSTSSHSTTSIIPQPTRVPPPTIYTTTTSTWPISNITDKGFPSWTPPPLEIIPSEDLEDSFNMLEEASSNRISSYEDAPINKIPDFHASQKHPVSGTPSTPSPSIRNTPTSTSSSFPFRPTQETPIVTVNDNQGNDITPYNNRNDKVKYGHKHDGKSLNSAQAKLNMGGIIALGVFGGFILLAITVTLILIFVRRTKSQRASRRSLDTTTITTYDSSGSGENGLHKFYKRAWENLRYEDKGSAFTHGFERPHSPVTRQETLDHPGIRGNGTIEGFREASEITVNDVAALYARPDKKDKKSSNMYRSGSHEHLREDSPSSDKKAIREWYSQQLGHHSRRGAFP